MDLAASMEELARQNRELVQLASDLLRQNAEILRRLDRLETEYYKHQHAGNNTLPS